MLTYLMLACTLILALTAIMGVWRSAGRPPGQSLHRLLAFLALALFVYFYGTWVYLSVYGKYVFGALVLAGALAGFIRPLRTPQAAGRRGRGLALLFTMLLGGLSVLYFTGTTGRAEKVELAFPLKKGRYFILQGGKGLPTNLFHYSYRGAIYAIDIVRLDDRGSRARRIFSSRLEDYHIFSDTVYSPCDGIIERTRDENPDNIPPDRTRGPSNTNQVLIRTDAFYVFMAHLKYQGVLVKEGQRVKTGDPVGLVGNSGFSLEPHLHIQAHKNTGKEGWYHEDPLYIEFDGRAYLLFEMITPKRVTMPLQ